MNSHTTAAFWKLFEALPLEAQTSARAAYAQFRANPTHPGLNFKKVNSRNPIYSARVGLHYRVVGVLEGDTIIWFWIGTHAEYDRLLTQL